MTAQRPLSLADVTGRRKPGRDGFVRADIGRNEWTGLGRGFAEGRQDLCAMWADDRKVRMALIAGEGALRAIVSLDTRGGRYPSVGRLHAPAIRLERAIHDLHGLTAEGLGDSRPWLDHGVWPASRRKGRKPAYAFLPVEGEGLHQIPVGPVHAGIIEPAHFRFTANGETVVRLEQRLGYVHKGVEALCAGAEIDNAARLVARLSGDSTVAYSFAFARAVELALGIRVPPRAAALRAIMAELERMAHHVSDFGAICNDASAVAIHAHCSLLRERILRVADDLFGHRLMMDRVVPGGVAADLGKDGARALRELLDQCQAEFARAVGIYDESPSILDRTVTTGITDPALVRTFAAGGFVGRAAGRAFDSRRNTPYPPYDRLKFDVALREDGDVNMRAWVRVDEVSQSIAIIRQLLARLPDGPVRARLRKGAGEGAALAEAFRGDVFISVRLDRQGRIARCHARDPSWFQWPLLEAAIEGNIVADFPLCNKSFNCSYSGHDL